MSSMKTWLLPLIALAVACSDADATASADDLTLATARNDFATQWGPTPLNSAGAPDGYDDCGPTSLLIAASLLGYLPRPTATTAESEIRKARNLTRGGVETPVSGATYLPMMLEGFSLLRMPVSTIQPNVEAIAQAVAGGAVVLVAGDPGNAWGIALDQKGEYLHHYGVGWGDTFGHWVVVYGRAVDHVRYVVGDPLSTTGPIKVTAAALARYMSDYASEGSSPGAIAVY